MIIREIPKPGSDISWTVNSAFLLTLLWLSGAYIVDNLLFPNPTKMCLKQFIMTQICYDAHFDGLVQDCSTSSVLAMAILQSFTKPSIFSPL